MASVQELRRKSPIYHKMFLMWKGERKSSGQQWTCQMPSLSSPNPWQLKERNFILHTILPSYLNIYALSHSRGWYGTYKALLYLQKWVSWHRGKHRYYFISLLRRIETGSEESSHPKSQSRPTCSSFLGGDMTPEAGKQAQRAHVPEQSLIFPQQGSFKNPANTAAVYQARENVPPLCGVAMCEVNSDIFVYTSSGWTNSFLLEKQAGGGAVLLFSEILTG